MNEVKYTTQYRCPTCLHYWEEGGFNGFSECPVCGEVAHPIIGGGADTVLILEEFDGVYDENECAFIAPKSALPDGFTFGKAIGIRVPLSVRAFMCYPVELGGPKGDVAFEAVIKGELNYIIFREGIK